MTARKIKAECPKDTYCAGDCLYDNGLDRYKVKVRRLL